MNTGIQKGIEGLRKALAEMASAAGSMLDRAILALVEGDATVHEAVRDMDLRLNEYELQLDRTCELLLVLREPFAVDFRFVFCTIKVTRDLERIGDEVKFAARWIGDLHGDAPSDLVHLARRARERYEAATTALIACDVAAARRLIDEDQEAADLEERILANTTRVDVAAIAHAFGRIAARTTNIAENTVYAVSATDLRHGHGRT